MLLNISFDQTPSSLPSGFVTAVNYVVAYFDHLFSDPITITINVGYREVNSNPLGAASLGSSVTNLNTFNSAALRSALAANAKSGDDSTAVASLPGSDPIGGTHT